MGLIRLGSLLALCLFAACSSPGAAQGVQVVYVTDPVPTFADGGETAQAYVLGFKGAEEPEPVEPHRTMLMRHANGTAYRCYIPRVAGEAAEEGGDGGSADVSPAEEGSLLPQKTPSELLEALKGHCYYRVEEWWTYELCYEQQLRQYHKSGETVVAEYVLGRWSAEEQERLDEVQIDSADVSGASPYIVHRYTGGEVCELTGQPRSAEVRFTCGGAADTLLVSVREPASCTYVITIATPRLCKHPGFQARPRDAALIQCHPVAEEEGAAQCGVAGSGAAAAGAAGGTAVEETTQGTDPYDEPEGLDLLGTQAEDEEDPYEEPKEEL